MPVICFISDIHAQCTKILFVFSQSEQPTIIADDILKAIINPKIINNQKIPTGREHLYIGHYYINLFE